MESRREIGRHRRHETVGRPNRETTGNSANDSVKPSKEQCGNWLNLIKTLVVSKKKPKLGQSG